MTDCIFCKIIKGDIPSTTVFRDEQLTAFRDINPAAPTHILIVPNRHIDGVDTLASEDEALVGHLVNVAGQIAAREGIAEGGYRLIINTGADAGQTVPHIHVHLLGGAPLKYPMG
jgi:histidine triad (HIT) family protein